MTELAPYTGSVEQVGLADHATGACAELNIESALLHLLKGQLVSQLIIRVRREKPRAVDVASWEALLLPRRVRCFSSRSRIFQEVALAFYPGLLSGGGLSLLLGILHLIIK